MDFLILLQAVDTLGHVPRDHILIVDQNPPEYALACYFVEAGHQRGVYLEVRVVGSQGVYLLPHPYLLLYSVVALLAPHVHEVGHPQAHHKQKIIGVACVQQGGAQLRLLVGMLDKGLIPLQSEDEVVLGQVGTGLVLDDVCQLLGPVLGGPLLPEGAVVREHPLGYLADELCLSLLVLLSIDVQAGRRDRYLLLALLGCPPVLEHVHIGAHNQKALHQILPVPVLVFL